MLGFLLLFHCFLWYNKSSEKGAENIWLVIQKIQKSSRTRTWSTNWIRRFPHRQNWFSLYKKHWKQTVWKKKTFVSRLNISRRSFLVLPVKNGKISMVSWIFLMKPSRKQIRHGNRNFLMTSLFRNISEKHDGHMQISLKMFLPATRSFLFRRRSETVQPAERRWNVLGKNSSAMNFALPLPKEK